MKRAALFCLLIFAALALVAEGAVAFSGSHTDWDHELIDQMTFLQKGPWGGRYDVIEVKPVDMSNTLVMGKKKAKADAEKAESLMNGWCQDAVRQTYEGPRPKMLKPGTDAASGARVAVLEWKCVEIDPGSWAKRFWIGFGAGHAGVTISGDLRDKATGKELLTFKHSRVNGIGFAVTGGRYMKVLNHSAVWTANDIGKMLNVVLQTPAPSQNPKAKAASPDRAAGKDS
ncbi:MAG: DUF4410 domain-containing protein [Acidobacteriota bacterium]